MKTILTFFAAWYAFFFEVKYFPLIMDAVTSADNAGYGKETMSQRADEAMGLEMLKDSIALEFAIFKVREPTAWDTVKLESIGYRAGRALRAAGWTEGRIQRKVNQIIDSNTEEN